MLNLSQHLTIDKDTIKSGNLCDKFSKEDLDKIGGWVFECFQRDVDSRRAWSDRTDAAMDLAMQIMQNKTFPWANCSNIAFPLVTIAALQFHSRAYPSIINGRSVVQCRVLGDDPQGNNQARADRISMHMSWQLLEQDEPWESQQDLALISVPIVGTAFKKSYYDGSKGHNVSTLVLAKDLVLDYYAKSVDDCLTKTHIIPMYRNDIYERVRRSTFRDVLEENWYTADATPRVSTQDIEAARRAGVEAPQSNQNTPFTLLEQHCWLDLDDDGYAEPYIVTIEQESQQVLRIVTRFDRMEDVEFDVKKRIVKIHAMEYFTKVPFIPSPDGGIMDIGFGVLLGPLNESVNAAINQMFDAGTLSNTAGGFLGRGAKIRGGVYSFKPFDWNRVDSTGDDLRKNIFPLPVREPSNVMFQLLGMLIDYTNRISGATDMLTGVNPGQNTPAETSRAMVEQGQKVYSAIFKRIWRSMKQEFKKLYVLNSIHLPDKERFGTSNSFVMREDYTGGGTDVIPVADPTITSDAARFARATMLREAALSQPGYDVALVERQYLRCLGIDNVDQVYPGVDPNAPQTPDVKVQVEQLRQQTAQNRLDFEKQQFISTLQQSIDLNNAKIGQLQAQAFKLMQEGQGEATTVQVNAFNAAIESMRMQNEQSHRQTELMLRGIESDRNHRLAQQQLEHDKRTADTGKPAKSGK